jgi:hypothetical protein
MKDDEAMSHEHEELFDRLQGVPAGSLYDYRHELVQLSKRISRGRGLYEVGIILEMLTASHAWAEAAEASTAIFDSIEDNVREKPRRLHAKLREIACDLEYAISRGKTEEVEQARSEWRKTIQEIKQDNEIHRSRRDPLRGLLGEN